MSSLGILSLDYLIAVYPFLLIVLTYFATVCFRDSLQFICKSCRTPIAAFKARNMKHSILNSFITFTILSCLKVLNVSLDILLPVTVYNIKSKDSRLALFYDSSIPYFSKEHLPYALLAILMTSVFVVLPTIILIIYPFKIFQRCLNGLPIRLQIVVRLVLDSIQGCYKNGAEPGTRDYRWFASIPYVSRFLPLLLLLVSTDLEILILFVVIVAVLLSLLLILINPYQKKFRHNSVHLTSSVLLMCIFALINEIIGLRVQMYVEVNYLFYQVCGSLVLICTFTNFVYIMISSCVAKDDLLLVKRYFIVAKELTLV